jgi:hypothetical protein
VLAQGRATIRHPSDEAEREAIRARAADHLGQLATGRFWDWWLRAYYDDRVLVDIAVERLSTWHDDACRGEPTVLGAPPPARCAADQRPPKDAAHPALRYGGSFGRSVAARTCCSVTSMRTGHPWSCR